jgi:hypothetical protein
MNVRKNLFCLVAILAVIVLAAPSGLLAKENMNEAKAWLDTHSDPAEIDVNGFWHSGNWDTVLLHQAKGAREITGTADNWEIKGVVSGKTLFLVFYGNEKIAYSATVTLSEDGTLHGGYAKGILQPGEKNIELILHRIAESKTSPAAQPGTATDVPAHVIVYRKHYHNCPQVHARLFVDGKEAADLDNGRYLTLNLSPGKHLIGTSKIGYMGSQVEGLDLAPGSTSYVNFEFPSAWVCTIEIRKADAWDAKAALSKLKPNDAKRVKMPDIVSLDTIGK